MEKIAPAITEVLEQYQFSSQATVQPFGNGLINHTSIVIDAGKEFILQKINTNVFKEPECIAHNIYLIEGYLRRNHPDYYFVAPVKTTAGQSMVLVGGEYYRLFPFVPKSRTYVVVESPDQAFETARQFGLFTHNLSGLAVEDLRITIPAFHDLSARYRQFEEACSNGSADRIQEARREIEFLKNNVSIVRTFETIQSSNLFKTRVTHHDTKISNVLFDQHNKGICVIDLDTVMPGFFISDVGDMLRTYLSPVSEEERDFSKVRVRDDYFTAIVNGYLSCMNGDLSTEELEHFVYAGMFMIYMQAIRFLTDYLNNDRYYGAAYEGHNYVRAQNQIILLTLLQKKQDYFDELVFKSVVD
jgi:Ser/Thr protein kinase RdoA (MazF antagonist)